MASFLDMDDSGRKKYVARLLNLHPFLPSSWPMETIESVIQCAEKAADQAARDECERIGSRGQSLRMRK